MCVGRVVCMSSLLCGQPPLTCRSRVVGDTGVCTAQRPMWSQLPPLRVCATNPSFVATHFPCEREARVTNVDPRSREKHAADCTRRRRKGPHGKASHVKKMLGFSFRRLKRTKSAAAESANKSAQIVRQEMCQNAKDHFPPLYKTAPARL